MSLLLAGNTAPRTLELSDLADAARRALRADAAAIVETSVDGRAVPLGDAGLTPDALADVLAALGARQRKEVSERGLDVPGFAAALVAEVWLGDGASVTACAVGRLPGGFENTGLIRAFAAHAALAVECAREQSPDPAPAGGGLIGLGQRVGDGLGYEELIAAVEEDVAAVIGPARIAIHLWDEDKQILQMLPGSLGADQDLIAAGRTAPDDWESSVARVFDTGRAYLANVARGDPGVLQDFLLATGLRRMLVLPLDAGDRRVGVLQVADKPDDFTVADLRAVERLTPWIAMALTFTRMRAQLWRRQRLDEILAGVAVDIAAGKSLQEFLGAALDALCSAAYAAVVALVPVTGEPIVWRHRDDRPALERIVVAEAREASGLRAYVIPPRCVGDPGWAAVHIPVHAAGARVATLAALRHRGISFNRDERGALGRFANLIALAWATERYQNQRATLARQSERHRIGDELHDNIAQLLFAARLRLDAALETPGLAPAAAERTERARGLVVHADEAIREIVHDLAEHGQDGLEDLLVAVVAAVEDEFGRPVQLEIAPEAAAAASTLRRPATDVLAKVAREALVNAAKHAGPCQLALRVSVPRRGRLLLAIADDGIGGARRGRGGHGLASLRRAVRRQGGILRVYAAGTGGTTVTVSLPV